MKERSSSEGVVRGRQEAAVPARAAAGVAAGAPALRIDFAHLVRDHLIVYGWIFGLQSSVAAAEVRHGEARFDLLKAAFMVPRPDVSKHLSAAPAVDDDHGFLLIADLSESKLRPASLILAVAMQSGDANESTWPVGRGDAQVADFYEQNEALLVRLMADEKPLRAEPLRELLSRALPPKLSATLPPAPASPFQVTIDSCCLLETGILLIWGSLVDRHGLLSSASVNIGSTARNFLDGVVFCTRPEISPTGVRAESLEPDSRFAYVSRIDGADAEVNEAAFSFQMPGRKIRFHRPFCVDQAKVRDDLAAVLDAFEGDDAIALIERIVATLGDSPEDASLLKFLAHQQDRAVARLPTAVESSNPRLMLHIDGVIPIASRGVFLKGWFHAMPGDYRSVVYHAGHERRDLAGNWVRHARKDVADHLAKIGGMLPESEHGFVSYVQLPPGRARAFVAVSFPGGKVRRLRLPAANAHSSAMQTVHALLTSFGAAHRNLRALLDRHVGPAVDAAWAGRAKPKLEISIERFGAPPTEPELSIIVPLFGRFDLAECQMALFANDPDMRTVELVYFVDDPTIVEEFRQQCADLHAIYRVPFILAHCGVNLGFAGANNRAAEIARGRQLLLMNSDVFPVRPGWTSKLLEIHRAQPQPGLLGVKLLFEDGSVQHAGMSFRRNPKWGGLWINYHPYKGQSGVGIGGTLEVPAVTAACVLVDAALYRELGGLSEEYIIGDFEDSDLCLRVAATGRRNRVALDVELYHLERQSQDRIGDAQWRTNLTLYNCWRHDQRWGATIAGIEVLEPLP